MRKVKSFIQRILQYLIDKLVRKNSLSKITLMSLRSEILKELYSNRGDGKNYSLNDLLVKLGKKDTDDDFQTTIKDLLYYEYISSVLDMDGFIQPVTSSTFKGLGEFAGITIRDSTPVHKYRILIKGEEYYERIKDEENKK